MMILNLITNIRHVQTDKYGAVEALHPGDVVEIEIPGIGTLRNQVVSEEQT